MSFYRRTRWQKISRAAAAFVRFLKLLDPRARRGHIYEIIAVDPRTRVQVCGYVGKTRQRVQARVQQHLDIKPWAPAVVDYQPVWSSDHVTNMGLFLREVWNIVTRRPIFNYEWNRLNPRRITIPRQREIYRPRVGAYRVNLPTSTPPTRYGARRPAGHLRTAGRRTTVR